MNVKLRMSVLPLLALGVAACASMPATTAQAPQHPAPTIMDIDQDYVAYVERVARRRGIEVVWVNQPRPVTGKSTSE